jgi:hypothetical protein
MTASGAPVGREKLGGMLTLAATVTMAAQAARSRALPEARARALAYGKGGSETPPYEMRRDF